MVRKGLTRKTISTILSISGALLFLFTVTILPILLDYGIITYGIVLISISLILMLVGSFILEIKWKEET